MSAAPGVTSGSGPAGGDSVIADLVEVAAVETVVRLDRRPGRLGELVVTDDVAVVLGAVLGAADGGGAFFLVAHFGAGASSRRAGRTGRRGPRGRPPRCPPGRVAGGAGVGGGGDAARTGGGRPPSSSTGPAPRSKTSCWPGPTMRWASRHRRPGPTGGRRGTGWRRRPPRRGGPRSWCSSTSSPSSCGPSSRRR
jgi:hypothetical protein